MTRLKPAWMLALESQFPGQTHCADSLCAQYAKDESWHTPQAPELVFRPTSTDDIVRLVTICQEHQVAITARGAGSALEGQSIPLKGGVCVDFSQYNQILEIDSDNMQVHVQAGVTRKQLQGALKGSGLFFSVDPGADATIAGMVATGASGTNTIRYGTIRENVKTLKVVLSDGQIIETGTKAKKSSAGYDLQHLMIGSEGTLGIFSEIRLKLHPLPECILSAVCCFNSISDTIEAAMQIMRFGIPMARLEYVDALCIEAINQYSSMSLVQKPTLFMEFHGGQASVKEQVDTVEQIIKEHHGSDFDWAENTEDRAKLWHARHNVSYATRRLKNNAVKFSTDVCVPLSHLAQCMLQTQKDIDETGLTAPIVAHIGDGNFHVMIVMDPGDDAQLQQAFAFNDRLIDRALAMGGTCTGEHGIGMGKQKSLLKEHGNSVALMAQIKQLLDPNQILNPGKIFKS